VFDWALRGQGWAAQACPQSVCPLLIAADGENDAPYLLGMALLVVVAVVVVIVLFRRM
jgi:hypothetical protein